MSEIDEIVEAINRKINIPFLNEEQERILIKALITMLINWIPKKNPS
jgi:hypothetical protein